MGARLNSTGVTVREALREGIAQLLAANTPSHALAAELLLMHATGHDRAWIYGHPEARLDAAAVRNFLELTAKRATGVPTQYLTGRQEFWGMEFEVTPAVLIPRPETEHVIEVALERLSAAGDPSRGLFAADIGTGSGCIAIALAKELPQAQIYATDISAGALELARRNATKHEVSERVRFVCCDLLEGIAAQTRGFDLVASNPPYVARGEERHLPREVREHEPHEALFSGASGAEIYPRLITQAGERLRTGGLLVVEVGYGAAEPVRGKLDESVWTDIRVTQDLAGIPRVISAERR